MKILFLLLLVPISVFSQTFSKVLDSTTNSFPSSNFYGGAAWIDFDNDGDLDLSLSYSNFIYINNGSGGLVKSQAFFNVPVTMKGITWADFNNDGFIDVFFSGANNHGPKLYKNNNGLSFSEVNTSPFNQPINLKGWGASWGDVNNDAFIDLIIAAPVNFAQISPNQKNTLIANNQSVFSIDTTTPITQDNAAFTVPTFYDIDEDNDIDLFIGSGPVTATGAPDWLFNNLYIESSNLSFQRINSSPLGTDFQDGQVWNFIDIDNDGDRDAFLTNYGLSFNNRIYINNGMGNYTPATPAQVGSIITTPGKYLSNSWGDYDNDGDIDVILTQDQGNSLLFTNNGNGFFVEEANAFSVNNNFTATNGDFNNDGYLDVFFSGRVNQVSLYENQNSGNNWIKLNLNGNSFFGQSNVSALGTKIKLWATINGVPIQQIREINAQNTFNGMNALEVHFGLGNAIIIDSISIVWPDGQIRNFTDLPLNQSYNLIQGSLLVGGFSNFESLNDKPFLLYPNPVKDILKFTFSENENLQYIIYSNDNKVVMEGRISNNSLDVSQLKNGYYILEFKIQQAKRTGFFIKN